MQPRPAPNPQKFPFVSSPNPNLSLHFLNPYIPNVLLPFPESHQNPNPSSLIITITSSCPELLDQSWLRYPLPPPTPHLSLSLSLSLYSFCVIHLSIHLWTVYIFAIGQKVSNHSYDLFSLFAYQLLPAYHFFFFKKHLIHFYFYLFFIFKDASFQNDPH